MSMSLSVCMMTNVPSAQAAVILEPLRPLATEILIAADARVSPQRLSGYARLADVVLRVEIEHFEGELPWLFAQCSGDWILRLDGDELPSTALIERLPGLLGRRAVEQYCFPQAWCYPRVEQVLDAAPWTGDFANRLVRNRGLAMRFGARQHEHVVPMEPLSYEPEPVYHLELLISDFEQRRSKAIRYEIERPGLQAPGGGRFNEAYYLPELRSEAPALREVPEIDVVALRRLLASRDIPDPGVALTLPVIPSSVLARYRPHRMVAARDRRAELKFDRARIELEPGEAGAVYVQVRNTGEEWWPGGLDAHPRIRLAYRLEETTGDVLAEGPRSSFGRPVEPGERLLARLEVFAPSEPGEYVLAVDVVHEDVAWFGAVARLPLGVRRCAVLPPSGPRLRPAVEELPVASAIRIPRLIHLVCLGETETSGRSLACGASFLDPGWEVRVWRDADLGALGVGHRERRRARGHDELANLARYAILTQHGGVSVATGVTELFPLDQLLVGVEAFVGIDRAGRVGTEAIGAVPGHRLFGRATELSRLTVGRGPSAEDGTGAYFLSLLVEQEPSVTVFRQERLCPPGSIVGESGGSGTDET